MRFAMTDMLPEGTDHIIPGATSSATREPLEDATASFRERAAGKAGEVKDQVSDKAMAFAESGKARASSALDEVAPKIGDTAGKIDGQIGAGYGDYARKAAEAVSGASATLRDKDVDELLEDARDLVRKSPAIAIGVAAAAGFALARILKAGSEALDGMAKAEEPAAVVSKAARKAPGKPGKAKSKADA
jgi:ElaB/YqjD/DUF883 family membrane-anchored ribosome-binding protein